MAAEGECNANDESCAADNGIEPEDEEAEELTECEDTDKECGYWASLGECDKNPNYMRGKILTLCIYLLFCITLASNMLYIIFSELCCFLRFLPKAACDIIGRKTIIGAGIEIWRETTGGRGLSRRYT